MYLLRLTSCCLCLYLVLASKPKETLQFKFPEVTVQAFSPRGLRVSIEDADGMQLFAFHGSINKPLNCVDAGDLSKDVVKKTEGRWIFEDRYIHLKQGDVINFWLFVIRHNLGYRLDNQSFTIMNLQPQPDSFLPNRRPTKRPGQPKPPTTTERPRPPVHTPVDETCVCPVCPQAITTPAPPAVSSSTPSTIHTIVNIWAESLNNATEEKIDLTNQVEYLKHTNGHLLKVLENIDDPNLKTLKMSGRVPSTMDPEMFVRNVIRDKLMIRDFVKNAERVSDNEILFEMESYQAKLNVLYAAKTKLANSKIVITDLMTTPKMNLRSNFD